MYSDVAAGKRMISACLIRILQLKWFAIRLPSQPERYSPAPAGIDKSLDIRFTRRRTGAGHRPSVFRRNDDEPPRIRPEETILAVGRQFADCDLDRLDDGDGQRPA